MADAAFRSPDRRFGLRIPSREVERMVALCREAKRNETGGILAGRYNREHDRAEVTDAIGPPADSRSGRTWFRRGVRGLQRIIDRFWERDRSHYLGEWHYHPHAASSPSPTDLSQMRRISRTKSYECPEPILLILGGDPAGELEARAFVFLPGSSYIELSKVDPEFEAR